MPEYGIDAIFRFYKINLWRRTVFANRFGCKTKPNKYVCKIVISINYIDDKPIIQLGTNGLS